MAVKTLEHLVLTGTRVKAVAELKRIGANTVVMERTLAGSFARRQSQRFGRIDYPPTADPNRDGMGRAGRSGSALQFPVSGSLASASIRLAGGWRCGLATAKPAAAAGRALRERLDAMRALPGGHHAQPVRMGMAEPAQPRPASEAFTASLRGRTR